MKLTETKNKIPEAESELAKAQAELSAAERESQKNTALLHSAQEELETIKQDKQTALTAQNASLKSLGELARATYRGDIAPSSVELIIGTRSAEDFINAYRANSAITRTQTNMLDKQAKASAAAANREARQDAVEDVISDLKRVADEIVEKRAQIKNEAQKSVKSLTLYKPNMRIL
ncbi:hypothetical protein RQN30_03365 [Arcanobacterium hippocoleae]